MTSMIILLNALKRDKESLQAQLTQACQIQDEALELDNEELATECQQVINDLNTRISELSDQIDGLLKCPPFSEDALSGDDHLSNQDQVVKEDNQEDAPFPTSNLETGEVQKHMEYHICNLCGNSLHHQVAERIRHHFGVGGRQ